MTRALLTRRGAAATIASAALLLSPGSAQAAGVWSDADLSSLTNSPPAAGVPFGYSTNLTNQGPVGRVIYRTAAGGIQELSVSTSAGWRTADLRAITGAPAPAAGILAAYTTDLTGQGPVARVVYRTQASRIQELSVGSDGRWRSTDLTTLTGAPPAASAPYGYTTSLTGQGPVGRVVYLTANNRIQELSVTVAGGWHSADLTALAGAPMGVSAPQAYTTNLAGQGPVGRVVYRTPANRIQELSVTVAGGWHSADLTAMAGAPAAAGSPWGYTTSLNGQGPAARVVYRTATGHIQELSAVNAAGGWHSADLTALTGAPAVQDAVIVGYATRLSGDVPAARVVYRTAAGRIQEISFGRTARWSTADLSQITGAPGASTPPAAFTTDLVGQGQAARVVYVGSGGRVHEISCCS
ncbi:hypothetical protein [Krasilnikovia sp. MM14-A1259]|uniref:hypothetical protein n=1 Tax=Krasilnikovia sp. MM14-A1259 TaxID=3373539 RepID=UPI0037F6579D